jgi:hypothetical protein
VTPNPHPATRSVATLPRYRRGGWGAMVVLPLRKRMALYRTFVR